MPGAKRPQRGQQLPLLPVVPARAASVMDPAERDRAIPGVLGLWFDAVARDLPWRRDRTPYAVWLSEVMLQQTRVDTVVPYFQRFMKRFPNVSALAAADLDDVLQLWSGLGYYRRARQLHLTAREVTAHHGGVFPAEAPELRALSGIGAYTAGAISSIAYGRREALVDGNVARVLARLEGIDDPIKSPEVVRRLWATAARLVPDDRPGRFNEALMELGATVCTPRDPRCDTCPVERFCAARAAGREREIPVTEIKRAVPRIEAVAAVLVDAGRPPAVRPPPRGRALRRPLGASHDRGDLLARGRAPALRLDGDPAGPRRAGGRGTGHPRAHPPAHGGHRRRRPSPRLPPGLVQPGRALRKVRLARPPGRPASGSPPWRAR